MMNFSLHYSNIQYYFNSTSFYYDYDYDHFRLDDRVPIGLPIGNTSFYAVKEENDLLLEQPTGCEGELWIGGRGVTLGYLHDPELTQQKFLPNPFGVGRIYRTGDIVKRVLLEDGTEPYVYIGRIDDQVSKILLNTVVLVWY